MSFLQNDPASCGVNNAVTKLNNRANGDNSLQQQLRNNNSQGSQLQQAQGQFNRFSRVDQRVQEEFHNFRDEHSRQVRPVDSSRFEVPKSLSQPTQFEDRQQPNQQQWVSDFRKLSLHDTLGQRGFTGRTVQLGSQTQIGRATTAQNAQAWSTEFNGVIRRQQQVEGRDSYIGSQGIISEAPVFNQTYEFGQSLNNAGWQYKNQTDTDKDKQRTDAAFESAFNDIDKYMDTGNEEMGFELKDDTVQKGNLMERTKNVETSHRMDESEKEKFADIAKSVFDAMEKGSNHASAKTNDKFRNSKFLHLMDRISKREIEINENNDKFIDSRGHDIRDDLPDPLRDLRETDIHNAGPFEAAKEVGAKQGQHISPSDWETDI